MTAPTIAPPVVPAPAWGQYPNLPCRRDPDAWFAGRKKDVAAAQQGCQPCPLKAECLAWALSTGQEHGVWGGELMRAGERPGCGHPASDEYRNTRGQLACHGCAREASARWREKRRAAQAGEPVPVRHPLRHRHGMSERYRAANGEVKCRACQRERTRRYRARQRLRAKLGVAGSGASRSDAGQAHSFAGAPQ